jgi:hypothetical protein
LQANTLKRLKDSPTRAEISKRLLTGESAVWVLVESGDDAKDNAAEKLLNEQFKLAEEHLEVPDSSGLDYSFGPEAGALPSQDAGSPADPPEGIPLKVDFSVLRISRDDPQETVLLTMLLGMEPDLDEYENEPITYPVFGQGRALWALVGQGINAENIAESCMFLAGPCSCQVKYMNPGVDLLMNVDWYGALTGEDLVSVEEAPPELTGVSALAEQAEHAQTAGTEAEADSASATGDQPASADVSGAAEVGTQVHSDLAADEAPPPPNEMPSTSSHMLFRVGGTLAGVLVLLAIATALLMTTKRG